MLERPRLTLLQEIEQSFSAFKVALREDWEALLIFGLVGAVVFFCLVWLIHMRGAGKRTESTDESGREFAKLGVAAGQTSLRMMERQIANAQDAATRAEARLVRQDRAHSEDMRDLKKSHADEIANIQRDLNEFRDKFRILQQQHDQCLRREASYNSMFLMLRNDARPETAQAMDSIMTSMDTPTS